MTMEILKEVSADEQLRTRIRFQEKAERDRRARMDSYWQDGLEQGLEQGLEKGREEGLELGMEKGRMAEKRSIAKSLMDILDDETISFKTGLSREEVSALRRGESL